MPSRHREFQAEHVIAPSGLAESVRQQEGYATIAWDVRYHSTVFFNPSAKLTVGS